MSAPAIEATMPARPAPESSPVSVRPTSQRPLVRPVCTAAPNAVSTLRQAAEEPGSSLGEKLAAAQRRTAELEVRLAVAEQLTEELTARNSELASDLDNALDQLAGHALHAEQERLVKPPRWSTWSAWTASSEQERHGFER